MPRPPPEAFRFRDALPADAAVLHALLGELAEYEGSPQHLRSTPAQLQAALAQGLFHALLVEGPRGVEGFATYTLDFMSWFGTQVLRLDDLFLRTPLRGRGLGGQLMRELARRALARGIAIRWEMQPGNASARGFYARLGASSSERTIWRWFPEAMQQYVDASRR
jgi:GNAT superfamily N-acetyltransferase